MRRRLSSCLLALLAPLAVLPPTATAVERQPDPDAPPGASAEWLPEEEWVLEHWMPYREADLERLTGITRDDVRATVSMAQQPLGNLVRKRGQDPRWLAQRLVRPWRGRVRAAQQAELARRALKTFTQPHLMEHMFGHPFHMNTLNSSLATIFGAPVKEIQRLRREQNMSRQEIGLKRGRTVAQMWRDTRRVIRRSANHGVRRKEQLPEQAKAWLSYQESRLAGWFGGAPNWNQKQDEHAHP